ncbi:hypothetical protein RvY_10038-1 [Ramazzottius varieornatus]|uniref:Uncharacterized protein n=1 Tax=Ramazzottius varieornatus TaxID=947166 RepID=A0A1D1VBE4_RAMVA|nr:hypothetical protein RvY_10038-1 [Ramazzottius varieornatus]
MIECNHQGSKLELYFGKTGYAHNGPPSSGSSLEYPMQNPRPEAWNSAHQFQRTFIQEEQSFELDQPPYGPFDNVPLRSLVTFPPSATSGPFYEEPHTSHTMQPSIATEPSSYASYPHSQTSVISYVPKTTHLFGRDDAGRWLGDGYEPDEYYNHVPKYHYENQESMFSDSHQQEAFEYSQSTSYENCC